MATTNILFQPSQQSTFSFLATFDGLTHNVIITANYYGQRYYANIYTVQGRLVVCLPLIESPDGYDISMTAGYYATELVFRASSRQFEVIDP